MDTNTRRQHGSLVWIRLLLRAFAGCKHESGEWYADATMLSLWRSLAGCSILEYKYRCCYATSMRPQRGEQLVPRQGLNVEQI